MSVRIAASTLDGKEEAADERVKMLVSQFKRELEIQTEAAEEAREKVRSLFSNQRTLDFLLALFLATELWWVGFLT